MWNIYDELINSVSEELSVQKYMVGLHWTIVRSEKGVGLAKTVRGGKRDQELNNITGMPLKKLASHIKSWNMIDASLGLAAINSTLNTSANLIEITDPTDYDPEGYNDGDFNAFTNSAVELMNKHVAVVGHFPKAEGLRGICQLSIIDKEPQPGDFPDAACEYILPHQDIVFITGTALINKTMPRLLALSANAQVILVGPNVPISPVLFKYGVDVIAGMIVADEKILWQAVQEGSNKDIYEQGGQRICITR